jgi:hypothetical protein
MLGQGIRDSVGLAVGEYLHNVSIFSENFECGARPNFRFASGEAIVSWDALASMTWSQLDRSDLTAQAYSQVRPGDGSKGGNP